MDTLTTIAPILVGKTLNQLKKVPALMRLTESQEPVVREFNDVSTANQWYQWLKPATEIWVQPPTPDTEKIVESNKPLSNEPLEDLAKQTTQKDGEQLNTQNKKPKSECFIAIGSLRNASSISTVARNYAGVINCCASEFNKEYPQLNEKDGLIPVFPILNFHDINEPELRSESLDAAYEFAYSIKNANTGKDVLIHCSMGASRSVAVAIFILGVYYRKHDYDYWLNVIRLQRPYINPSLALRQRIIFEWTSTNR